MLLHALGCSALVFFALAGVGQAAGPGQPPAEAGKAAVVENYGRLPLYFIENRGQVDQQVKYYARGSGHTTFFTQKGVVLALAQNDRRRETGDRGKKDWAEAPRPAQPAVVRMTPVGMKKKVKIKALQPQEGKVNYFIGNNPKKWHTEIPTYQAVVYEEAYRGIDLKFYGHGRQLEYDVVVKPGADPGQVRFAYRGVKELRVTDSGDLALMLPDGGELIQQKPVVYQEIAGQRVPREARFAVHQNGARLTCGFRVAAYDKARPLVIDPVLVYSTYLGGSGSDAAYGVAVDYQGCAYLAGTTESANFPTQSPYQYPKPNANSCAFVTKFNASGNGLVYSTFLGGNNNEYGYGIALDGAENVYVCGVTFSSNFPNSGQSSYKGQGDGFVTKFGAGGGSLVYSAFLGGQSFDYCRGIAVDGDGNAYVTGRTASPDFPLVDPYQLSLKGSEDAFVTKYDPTGQRLFSTFLGGSSYETGYAVAVDAARQVHVAGYTHSDDFPLANPFQAAKPGVDPAFVTKFQADGQALLYSTYLGGSGSNPTEAHGVGVAANGIISVAGITQDSYFPVKNAYQANLIGVQAPFVSRLNPGLAGAGQLIFSTFFGGGYADLCNGCWVDPQGNTYITGRSAGTVPVINQLTPPLNGSIYVAQFSPGGIPFLSLLFGGQFSDHGNGSGMAVALDRNGNIYVAGSTSSVAFPVKNPFQATLAGGSDAFLTKIFRSRALTGVYEMILQ